MKKERILYILLAVLFVGYVVVEQYKPKPLIWTPTFSHLDKNPFGGYVLFDRLEDLFNGGKKLAFQTFYELEDSTGHIIVLASQFEPSGEDIRSVFKILESGRDVMIASEFFPANFLDTLGIEKELNVEIPDVGSILYQDSIGVRFGDHSYYYPMSIVKSQFKLPDTSLWEVHANTHSPIVISKVFGEGRLVLSSTPLAYTNYGILKENNFRFSEQTFNLITDGEVIYNRYYQSGRTEPQTPFRYLLSQASLKWALYLTLMAIFILVIFESQRKQRVIPLLDPKTNTTIRYVKTIGGLYYREGKHQGAAMKLIQYFLKSLAEKYYVSSFQSESTYRILAAKTGLTVEEVIKTFELIQQVRKSKNISEGTLKNLHHKISLFNVM